MAIGHIYILKNNFIPTLVKIGYTERSPEARARELSNFTGVPGDFTIVFSWIVAEPACIEKKIHFELGSLRRAGEFFELGADEATKTVRELLVRFGAIKPDGFSYEAQKIAELEIANKNRLKKLREVESDRNSLNQAIRAIHDQLIKINKDASRIADYATKPKGLFSFLSHQDQTKRIEAFRSAFELKRSEFAIGINMDWVTGSAETLPRIFSTDYHFCVPDGPYGDFYKIPKGTSVRSSSDWIIRGDTLLHNETREEIQNCYVKCRTYWFRSTYNPFFFTIIKDDLRVLVGPIQKDPQ